MTGDRRAVRDEANSSQHLSHLDHAPATSLLDAPCKCRRAAVLVLQGLFDWRTPGRHAAQRYPDDFDAIIAGALANRHIQMHTAGVSRSIDVTRRPELTLPREKAALVSERVMKTCDTLEEEFLTNPRACTVDLSTLACSGSDDRPDCLASGLMESVTTFYGGVKNSTGELIFSGQALGNPIAPLE